MTKPNKKRQFDLLYMPHNLFEGNIYKYILTGVDVESRYNVARPLSTKKPSGFVFVLEATDKYPKTLQCYNAFEFKSEVIKLLEKHKLEIQRPTTKYKHSRTAFMEALTKS